ncbi:ABC transporter ATP-binding protein [Actinomyces slackii]|uniref:Fluoroquinolones export ATP-binding protein Rv2688c/MT2762 n=2 Tax=Actinomyces slackii TaxID=52774 RepID=A0A3S4UNS5_9ACTO|nr:Fluoroquinolones export ATP-binding protein Rv2688c/MT2762 [Actinomyces slackii]
MPVMSSLRCLRALGPATGRGAGAAHRGGARLRGAGPLLGADPAMPALLVRDLGYSYRGAGRRTLRGIDLEVPAGQVLGLLGPSGAGKSTLQRVLIGLLPRYTGSARVLGREVLDWGRGLYERIGVGFERPVHLGRLTLRENLVYFSRMYARATRDPDELLAMVGLGEDAEAPAAHMSKGMGIRLNLARALLPDPELLFLDEPTSGLDPAAVARVEAIIDDQRRRGCTVVVTTHDMTLAQTVCDRVGFVVDGRVVELGRPQALRRRYGQAEVTVSWEGGSASFPLAGLADDEAFHAALRRHEVHSMHSREADLAEVFLAVTGRSLG